MIFVNENIDNWLEKYPELEIVKRDCDHCKKEMVATMPFITKDYIGLRAPDCGCGKNQFTAMSMVTRSNKKYLELLTAFNNK